MYKRLLTMLLKSKETDVCFHFLRDKALTIWGCVQKKKKKIEQMSNILQQLYKRIRKISF